MELSSKVGDNKFVTPPTAVLIIFHHFIKGCCLYLIKQVIFHILSVDILSVDKK